MHDRIKEYIYANKNELLTMLGELVAVKSVKGEPQPGAPFGAGPRAALDKAAEMCRLAGFDTRICADVVGNADFTIGNEPPVLGILCHLDVVSAEGQEGWRTDPFVMTEKDGVLYGRGVIDDKGPFCAALIAIKCIKDLGVPLGKGVRLIFGTDEENGSEDLDIYLEQEKLPPQVITPDASFPVINIEKGRLLAHFGGSYPTEGANVIRFHGGNIPNAVADRAECTVVGIDVANIGAAIASDTSGAVFETYETEQGVTIKCTGRSAHAATPESGINAVTALIGLLCGLPLAQCAQTEILRKLNETFPFGETDGAHAELKASDMKSGALTLVFSKLDMENGECAGCIDIRFPTCLKLSEVTAGLRGTLNSVGLADPDIDGSEPHVVDEDSELVRKLLAVYERCEGEKGHCIAIGGGTYVHNIPGGVAFGVERGDTDYRMHGANEFITVDELLKDAVLYAEAIIEICG